MSGGTATTASSKSAASKAVNVSALRVGMCLSQDIYDQNRVLLLTAGTEITPRFLRALESRNIQTVVLKPSIASRAADSLQSAFSQRLDEILVKDGEAVGPLPPLRTAPESVRALAGNARKSLEVHATTSRMVQNLYRSTPDSSPSVEDVQSAVHKFVDMIALDVDLLPNIVAMQQPQNEYLFDHSVNVSLLSMSIAAQLGMSNDQLMEIGCGALLQDIGMLAIDEHIRFAPRPLTLMERLELERHPIHTLERLQRIPGLPSPVAYIGYQVHERMDGSGYPRRRKGPFIHQYARIVAVADVYSAMTKPRPYRPPLIPYLAARTIVFEAHYDKLDRVCVRGFLDCVSLFPIGSIVELSNGLKARTVRANPGAHTRPVVNVIGDDFGATDQVIDLQANQDISIRRVLPPEEMMELDPEALGPLDSDEATL